jgi:hypothetical protein
VIVSGSLLEIVLGCNLPRHKTAQHSKRSDDATGRIIDQIEDLTKHENTQTVQLLGFMVQDELRHFDRRALQVAINVA